MTLKISQNAKGILTVIGTCFFNLVVGSIYIWGNISIYVSSYYPNTTSDEVSIVFPITAGICNIGILFSYPAINYLGFRVNHILATILIFGFFLGSSFCSTFWSFFWCFAIGYGISTGLLYLSLLYNAYKYFPSKRGLIGGVVMGFYGLAALISNYILLLLVNPDNIKAEKNPITNEYHFPYEIAERFPTAIRYLSFYFLGAMIIANLLQFEFQDPLETDFLEIIPEETGEEAGIDENPSHITFRQKSVNKYKVENSNDDMEYKFLDSDEVLSSKKKIKDNSTDSFNNIIVLSSKQSLKGKKSKFSEKKAWSISSIDSNDERECFSLKDAFKSRAVYFMMIMIFCSTAYGYFVASNFKNYGIMKISEDSFLTLIGSLSSFFNGGGRFFWGLISDKFGFKKTYLTILIIQIINAATLRFASDVNIIYLIWVCLAMLCEGGNFVIFPPLSLKIFGPNVGSKVYTCLLMVCALSNFTQYGTNIALRSVIGYDNEFYVFLAFTIISFILCLATDLKFKR